MGAPKISNAEKAAMVLIGLGEDVASEVLKNMTTTEVRRVVASMSQLGKVDPETLQSVMTEFQQLMTRNRPQLKGGADFVRGVLDKAFRGTGHEQDFLQKLNEQALLTMTSVDLVDAPQLARLLLKEQPQTIALVMAHTDPRKAAACLKELPANLHTDIVMRIATLESVDPETILEIDNHLRQEIESMSLRGHAKLGGRDKVAAILNALDKNTETRIVDQLTQISPQLSDEIRQKMFTFEDLRFLDPRSMQELIKNVPTDHWKVALRGTSEALQSQIFHNLSQRAGQMLREDMEASGPMKVQDVRNQQNAILATAQKLADAGKLNLSKKQDEYV